MVIKESNIQGLGRPRGSSWFNFEKQLLIFVWASFDRAKFQPTSDEFDPDKRLRSKSPLKQTPILDITQSSRQTAVCVKRTFHKHGTLDLV